MKALPGLLSFEGRARRSEWWLTCIATALLAGLFVAMASLALSGGDLAILRSDTTKPASIVILNLIVGALVFWIQTAVGVRRSHDRGQSGTGLILYQVLGYGSSYIPMIVYSANLDIPVIPFAGAFLFALAVILLIVAVYFLVTLGFLNGQPTANAYGQSPKMTQNQNYAAPRFGD